MAKWSPDGKLLASASTDKSVRIWTLNNTNELRCISVLEGVHQRTIRAVDWSPNGKFLACCSFDGTVSVWTRMNTDSDQVEYECIATLEGHENEVKAVAWSRDGTLLATCGRDKSVWIWETESEGEFECLAVLNGHSQDVKTIVWHPTHRILFSCSYDDTIKVWAEEDLDWCCVNTLKAHDSTVWSLAFQNSGTQFVSVGDDCKMYIWDSVSQNDEGKECKFLLS
jgi:WD40 repeat protein